MSTWSPAAGLDDVVALLERTWGRPVELTYWRPVDTSLAHAGVRIGSHEERVVVKWVRADDPRHPGFRSHQGQVAREHAALRFVHDVVGPIAAAPIACSPDLLVMEDLSPRFALSGLLLTDPDEPAELGLVEMVDLLAKLHVGSHARLDAFAARLPDGWSPWRPGHHDPATAAPRRPSTLDVPGLGFRAGAAPRPGPDATVELDDLVARLAEPGEFAVLSTGDVGPNNVLVAPGLPARLVDFEFAGYAHACVDLVPLYLPHPAWVTATDPVGTGLERRYRDAMTSTAPGFADDGAFGWGLSAASVAWTVDRLSRFELCDDRPPGHPSRLQLLVTVEAAVSLVRDRSAYPAIADWLAGVGTALRRRWPETDLDVAALPPWLPRLDG